VVSLDAPILQAIPDEVVLDPDVLASAMEDWVLGNRKGRLAVHLELHHIHLAAQQLSEQPGQSQRLCCCRSGGNVLCLAA